jgi:WD40 repeat protein
VAVTADGKTAVSGSYDRTVRAWDLSTGRCTAAPERHTGGVTSVAVTADGKEAVSGSRDRTVRTWDLSTGRCVATYASGSKEANKAWAKTQQVPWDLSREPQSLTLRPLDDRVVLAFSQGRFTAAACSSDGRHVIAGDGQGTIYLLRRHTRQG